MDGEIDVEPGPYLWRTLRAQESGATPTAGKEALLYTDSRLTATNDRIDLGAATVQVAVGSLEAVAPAARVVLRWWEYEESDAPLRPDYEVLVDNAQDYWLGMHVDQEFAGRGVGTRLLTELIALARCHGYWMVQSSIIADNDASRILHGRAGFREVGRRERIARATRGESVGQWLDTYLYELRL